MALGKLPVLVELWSICRTRIRTVAAPWNCRNWLKFMRRLCLARDYHSVNELLVLPLCFCCWSSPASSPPLLLVLPLCHLVSSSRWHLIAVSFHPLETLGNGCYSCHLPHWDLRFCRFGCLPRVTEVAGGVFELSLSDAKISYLLPHNTRISYLCDLLKD